MVTLQHIIKVCAICCIYSLSTMCIYCRQAGIHANFSETDQTEMNCEQLAAIKHDDRKMITATYFNFLDDLKENYNASLNCLQGPSSKHTQIDDTVHHGNRDRGMMKMPGWWYGRSSSLMLIKPCYTVKAVCHKGLCESNQPLVTPLGIHQHSPWGRLVVLGTERLHRSLFTDLLQLPLCLAVQHIGKGLYKCVFVICKLTCMGSAFQMFGQHIAIEIQIIADHCGCPCVGPKSEWRDIGSPVIFLNSILKNNCVKRQNININKRNFVYFNFSLKKNIFKCMFQNSGFQSRHHGGGNQADAGKLGAI